MEKDFLEPHVASMCAVEGPRHAPWIPSAGFAWSHSAGAGFSPGFRMLNVSEGI